MRSEPLLHIRALNTSVFEVLEEYVPAPRGTALTLLRLLIFARADGPDHRLTVTDILGRCDFAPTTDLRAEYRKIPEHLRGPWHGGLYLNGCVLDVDLWKFWDHVGEARRVAGDASLTHYARALDLWSESLTYGSGIHPRKSAQTKLWFQAFENEIEHAVCEAFVRLTIGGRKVTSPLWKCARHRDACEFCWENVIARLPKSKLSRYEIGELRKHCPLRLRDRLLSPPPANLLRPWADEINRGTWDSIVTDLDPGRRRVPYQEPDGLLRALLSWTDVNKNIAMAVLTGPGGCGKSRLAVELCTTMEDAGWVAGFMSDLPLSEVDIRELGQAELLVVVDNAEARREAVGELLASLRNRQSRSRVVLIIRLSTRTTIAKWIVPNSPMVSSLINDAKIVDVSDSLIDTQALFTSAAQAFAPGKRLEMPPITAHESTIPLFVIGMAAVVSRNLSSTDLLQTIVEHERDIWIQRAKDLDVNCSRADLDHALAVTTLLGATSREEAELIVARLPWLVDQSFAQQARFGHFLATLYGGASSDEYTIPDRIEPIRLDRVAEELVAEWFVDHDPRLLRDALNDATDSQLARALNVLSRATESSPALAKVVLKAIDAKWLDCVLSRAGLDQSDPDDPQELFSALVNLASVLDPTEIFLRAEGGAQPFARAYLASPGGAIPGRLALAALLLGDEETTSRFRRLALVREDGWSPLWAAASTPPPIDLADALPPIRRVELGGRNRDIVAIASAGAAKLISLASRHQLDDVSFTASADVAALASVGSLLTFGSSVGERGEVVVIDVDTGHEELRAELGAVTAVDVVLTPAGHVLAAFTEANADRAIWAWHRGRAGEWGGPERRSMPCSANAIRVVPGKGSQDITVLLGSPDGKLIRANLGLNAADSNPEVLGRHGDAAIWWIEILAQGKLLRAVTTGEDGRVVGWAAGDCGEWAQSWNLTVHSARVWQARFVHLDNAPILLTCGDDGLVVLTPLDDALKPVPGALADHSRHWSFGRPVRSLAVPSELMTRDIDPGHHQLCVVGLESTVVGWDLPKAFVSGGSSSVRPTERWFSAARVCRDGDDAILAVGDNGLRWFDSTGRDLGGANPSLPVTAVCATVDSGDSAPQTVFAATSQGDVIEVVGLGHVETPQGQSTATLRRTVWAVGAASVGESILVVAAHDDGGVRVHRRPRVGEPTNNFMEPLISIGGTGPPVRGLAVVGESQPGRGTHGLPGPPGAWLATVRSDGTLSVHYVTEKTAELRFECKIEADLLDVAIVRTALHKNPIVVIAGTADGRLLLVRATDATGRNAEIAQLNLFPNHARPPSIRCVTSARRGDHITVLAVTDEGALFPFIVDNATKLRLLPTVPLSFPTDSATAWLTPATRTLNRLCCVLAGPVGLLAVEVQLGGEQTELALVPEPVRLQAMPVPGGGCLTDGNFSAASESWELAADVAWAVDNVDPTNPFAGASGTAEWKLLTADVPAVGKIPELLSQFNRHAYGSHNLRQWAGGIGADPLPAIGTNIGDVVVRPVLFEWPPDAIRLHPGHGRAAIVAWTAPFAGRFLVEGYFADMDRHAPRTRAPLLCQVGICRASRGSLDPPVVRLELAGAGPALRFKPIIELQMGDAIYFDVEPQGIHGHRYGSTRLSVAIRPAPPWQSGYGS